MNRCKIINHAICFIDFFVSVVMFLKCCHPKDTAEFIVNCLCPIIEHYLNTQQDEAHAVKTIESISNYKKNRIECILTN